MKYKVEISEGEDGWCVVECPPIPGCVSHGTPVKEALENIKDVIYGCLMARLPRISGIKQLRLFLKMVGSWQGRPAVMS